MLQDGSGLRVQKDVLGQLTSGFEPARPPNPPPTPRRAKRHTQGISCAKFDTLLCVDKADGTFFENNADCGTPFCHQTYVVCYANAPTVQSCPDGTVWGQEALRCVAPVDAPGACPVRFFCFAPLTQVLLNPLCVCRVTNTHTHASPR